MTTHPTTRTPARPARVRLARRPVPAWAAAWAGAVMGVGFVLCMIAAMSLWVPGVILGGLVFAVGMRASGRRVSRYVDLGPVKYE